MFVLTFLISAISPAGVKKKLTKKRNPSTKLKSGSSSASSSCSATPLASPIAGAQAAKKPGGTAKQQPVYLDLSSPKAYRDRFPLLRKLDDSEILGIKTLAEIHHRGHQKTVEPVCLAPHDFIAV